MAVNKPQFVYTIYITTTAEKLWSALTESEFSEKYWFGSRIQSEWKVGSSVNLLNVGDERNWHGEVLQFDPPRLLSFKFRVVDSETDYSRVSFELVQNGPVVKLTLIHDELNENDEKFVAGISRGWPAVLSNLKSFLEGGHPAVPRPC
jgi:uncharacterized protein YndB with AHSA1/START domain